MILNDREKRDWIQTMWDIMQKCFPQDQLPLRTKFDLCVSEGDVFVSGPLLRAFAVVTPYGDRSVKIRNICTSPESRGQGLATTLLVEVKWLYGIRDKTSVILDVRVDNEVAIRLYERHGFKYVRILMDKYGPGQDGQEMECTL